MFGCPTRYTVAVRVLGLLVLVACGSHGGHGPDGGSGSGGDGGGGSNTADAQSCSSLAVTLRDFTSSHPDFEKTIGDDRGVIAATIGSDHKPVYVPAGVSPGGTISGPTSYNQWYRDVPGTNMTFTQQLPLTQNPPGTFVYDNQAFFPLDGMGFPETFDGHNFHFTTEIHTSFVYRGGEVFTFTGDDDVWVFVNDHLAIDLGGVHGAENASIDFDAQAATLGITHGGTYRLDVFHAERHTTESHFRMATTIDCFVIQ